MKLRRKSLDIDTVPEGHMGAFAGSDGRYALRSTVEVHKVIRAWEKCHDA
jgi:hypothetical protein